MCVRTKRRRRTARFINPGSGGPADNSREEKMFSEKISSEIELPIHTYVFFGGLTNGTHRLPNTAARSRPRRPAAVLLLSLAHYPQNRTRGEEETQRANMRRLVFVQIRSSKRIDISRSKSSPIATVSTKFFW